MGSLLQSRFLLFVEAEKVDFVEHHVSYVSYEGLSSYA